MILILLAFATMAVTETIDACVAALRGQGASAAVLWLIHLGVAGLLAFASLLDPLTALGAAGLAVAIGVIMRRIAVPPTT